MRKYIAMFFAVLTVLSLASVAGATSVMDPIFTAVDITGLSTGVTTILTGLIGVILLFVAYKFARKALGR